MSDDSVCSLVTQAQSGRRQQRTEPAAPVPTPTPEATPAQKPEEGTDLILFVGADRSGSFTPHFIAPAMLPLLVALGLRKNGSASVDSPKQREVTSGKPRVIQRLTSSICTGSFYGRNRKPSRRPTEFASLPQYRESCYQRHPYQNARRAGPVILGPTGGGSTSMLYREQLLKRAGEDAAERILKSLHLNEPVRTN